MTNVDYYNNLAKVYDLIYSEEYIGDLTKQELDFIDKYIKPNSTLIDVGCGTGRHIAKLSTRCEHIVGIDNSKAMLNLARKKFAKCSNVEFLDKSVEELNDVSKYDIAIMLFTVANHIIDENTLQRGFKNVWNSLKNGGIYIFDLTNFYSFLENYKSQLHKIYYKDGSSCIRFNSHSIDEYNQMFINNEFTIYSDNKNNFNYSDQVRLKMYSVGEIRQLLNNSGFLDIEVFSNWTFLKTKSTKRHIFVCKK